MATTVRHGSRFGVWNTKPKSCCDPRTSWPRTSTQPRLACVKPATIRSKVVLPQPLGPKQRYKLALLERIADGLERHDLGGAALGRRKGLTDVVEHAKRARRQRFWRCRHSRNAIIFRPPRYNSPSSKFPTADMSQFVPPFPPGWKPLQMARQNFIGMWEESAFELDFSSERVFMRKTFLCNSPESVQFAFSLRNVSGALLPPCNAWLESQDANQLGRIGWHIWSTI